MALYLGNTRLILNEILLGVLCIYTIYAQLWGEQGFFHLAVFLILFKTYTTKKIFLLFSPPLKEILRFYFSVCVHLCI